MIRSFALFCLLPLLGACVVDPGSGAGTPTRAAPAPTLERQKARDFVAVVQAVEPVAERECRARTRGVNCDFQIAIDDTPGAPANAFQTLDRTGRPFLVFTLQLVGKVRNRDELAFIMGHEAAHHIEQHIAEQRQQAILGSTLAAVLTAATGASQATVQQAVELGGQVGARRFSKEHELEADALGTIIAAKAGFDPVLGAAYFDTIRDPGDQFLGTHPPNAARKEIVRRTAAGL